MDKQDFMQRGLKGKAEMLPPQPLTLSTNGTGTRGEGRTLNLRLRRPTLYPIELLAQCLPSYHRQALTQWKLRGFGRSGERTGPHQIVKVGIEEPKSDPRRITVN